VNGLHSVGALRVSTDSRTNAGLYQRVADGSSEAELLKLGEVAPGSWSPDGTLLAYWDYPRPTDWSSIVGDRDIGVMSRNGELSAVTDTPFQERSPRFSPDGRWLAYISDESGRDQVYIQPYPGPGLKVPISTSTNGGTEPVWSPDGREVYYRTLDGNALMAVPIEYQPTLAARAPVRLFALAYPQFNRLVGAPNYDVAPDGERFLMLRPAEPSTTVHVILNWTQEQLERVPVQLPMPLKPGTTLGPYSVTAKIGEGGMGEVYQARDTKLDRDVALKVLPEAFTADPDRLARFEREAKVLASLNEP